MDKTTLVVVGILAVVLILANIAERRRELRPLLHGILALISLLFILVFALNVHISSPTISPASLNLVRVLAVIFGLSALLMLLAPVRQALAGIFVHTPRTDEFSDPDMQGGFDPSSMVHMTALIYCLFFLANTILSFILSSGLAGLAATFEPSTAGDLLTTMSIFLLFAFLGVGLGTRRSFGRTLLRLGFRAPTSNELLIGVGMAFILFFAENVISWIWVSLTPPDLIQQQTQFSRLISDSINTMFIAFLVASTAAIGEEIIFRGALQPIFGIIPTAIFFALSHIQYTLTPATLIIIVIALGLGWLRRQYNTTTSIVAHFLYDFVPLALGVYLQYVEGVIRLHR